MQGRDVKVEFSMDGGQTWAPLGTVDVSSIEDLGPVPLKLRLYNVIWVRDDTGTRGQFNATPMTHSEACTFKSKITEYPWRRVLLEEV